MKEKKTRLTQKKQERTRKDGRFTNKKIKMSIINLQNKNNNK